MLDALRFKPLIAAAPGGAQRPHLFRLGLGALRFGQLAAARPRPRPHTHIRPPLAPTLAPSPCHPVTPSPAAPSPRPMPGRLAATSRRRPCSAASRALPPCPPVRCVWAHRASGRVDGDGCGRWGEATIEALQAVSQSIASTASTNPSDHQRQCCERNVHRRLEMYELCTMDGLLDELRAHERYDVRLHRFARALFEQRLGVLPEDARRLVHEAQSRTSIT